MQHRLQETDEFDRHADLARQRAVQPQRDGQPGGLGRDLLAHGDLMGEGQRAGIVQHLGAVLFDILQRAHAGGGTVNLLTIIQSRQKVRASLRNPAQRRIRHHDTPLPCREPRQRGKTNLRPVQEDLV